MQIPLKPMDYFCVKDGIPTDEELEELADQFGQNWKKLGRRLDVPEPKLEEIDHAHGQISEKGYFMLKYWKQKKGSAATYQALCDALEHKLVQWRDLAEKFCYIREPTTVRSRQLPVGHIQEERATGEVTGASAAGVYSGTSAQHQDNSSRVKRHLKRKSLDPNPERGNLSWKISCLEAISRNSGNQDLQEEREKVNRYMEEKIDEVTSERTFDLSTFKGIHRFNAYLIGELHLMDVNFERSSIKVIVKCSTLEILEDLWHDYCSGHLNEVAEECLITEQVKEELGMETIKLKTTILEEDYVACKLSLMETAGSMDLGRNTQNMAIPLCLPNNCQWSAATGEYINTGKRRSSLYVVEDALQKLRTIKEPVCVVSIVGPCRDGKSFILGEVFNQPGVFPVGFKMDPETMGIWIWILPHTMKDYHGRDVRVVLLDSEGTKCAEADGQQDNQIFTLIVLLATILIYNSKGVPKRHDLDQMEFVLKLSHQIQARSGSQSRLVKNEDAFHKTFPHFIWLLRDVMTDIPDDCRDIKEYFLTRVFKGTGASENDKAQNIAESILHFFSGFDAFCLPPPAFDKNLMKDIKRNKDRMNPEFFAEVDTFKRILHSNIGPKKSCNEGEYVNGEGLAVLTKLYLDAINDPNSIPNVQTSWETHVQRKCQDAKRKAMLAYDKKIKAALFKLPCDGDKILASHESAIRQSMTIFNEETAGISSDHTKRDYEELMNKGIEKLAEWKAKNDSLTKDACEKLLKELKRKHLDPVLERARGPNGANVSYKEIDDGLARIELEYKNQSVGAKNIRAKVFHEFHERFKAECDQNKQYLKAMKDYNKELLEQRHKNAEQDKETEKLREEAAYLKNQQKIQGQKLKDLEEKKNKELTDKVKEYEATAEILHNKIYDLEKAGMEKKMSDLETERDKAKEDKLQMESELKNLKGKFEIMSGEITKLLRLQQLPWWKKLFGMTE